ncbi:uncharacterized protein LOC120071867 [Benincasa hispida]|uniref:uncharacterized protein LOC120071867 n=1 Tax=Benincasa hispida TaxID=102211 RepID=UPI0019000BCA|nr:uncharacterized protein LOC120071867 [Benincasa hispida]
MASPVFSIFNTFQVKKPTSTTVSPSKALNFFVSLPLSKPTSNGLFSQSSCYVHDLVDIHNLSRSRLTSSPIFIDPRKFERFTIKLQFSDQSPKLPPTPPGVRLGKLSSNNLVDSNSAPFRLEFGNGEFSGVELKKIMANDKLIKIALTDPKHAKRILANHQSAARSKELKT